MLINFFEGVRFFFRHAKFFKAEGELYIIVNPAMPSRKAKYFYQTVSVHTDQTIVGKLKALLGLLILLK